MRRVLSLSIGLVLTAALTSIVPGASAAPSVESARDATAVRQAAPNPHPKAGTAFVVGTTGTPGANHVPLAGNALLVQVAVATSSSPYTVPGAGVLTSISHDAGTGGLFRAVLFGPGASPTSRSIRGYSPKLAAFTGTLNTYPVRIPVAADTILGIWTETVGMAAVKTAVDPVDSYFGTVQDPTTTTTMAVGAPIAPRQVNISAVWEPDVDGDGFGDVSQDLCPLLAAAQSCPAPETTVTKAPKKSSTKRKARIVFSSSVPGSTFTCAVDQKPGKPCGSPFTKKVKLGKHTVVITATSPFGIVETTPVTVRFQVRKPR